MREKQNGAYPEEITVLVAEPGKPVRVKRIVPVPEVMERIVGGNAKEICPFADPVAVIFNGGGGGLHFSGCLLLRNGSDQPYAVIRGTFLVAGVYDGNYVSLTKAQMMRILKMFRRDRLSGVNRRYPAVSTM